VDGNVSGVEPPFQLLGSILVFLDLALQTANSDLILMLYGSVNEISVIVELLVETIQVVLLLHLWMAGHVLVGRQLLLEIELCC